jgi:hypothetical protein
MKPNSLLTTKPRLKDPNNTDYNELNILNQKLRM